MFHNKFAHHLCILPLRTFQSEKISGTAFAVPLKS